MSEQAEHFCPALLNAERHAFMMAWSRSHLAVTMMTFLPPVSALSGLQERVPKKKSHPSLSGGTSFVSGQLVEPQELVGIADEGKVSLEILEADDDSSPAIVGMEGQRLAARIRIVAVIKQASIEEEVYMMLPVVDESEGRNAARFEPKVLHHAFWRSERELSTRGFPLRLVVSAATVSTTPPTTTVLSTTSALLRNGLLLLLAM